MANERRLIDANEIEELFYAQVEYGATDLMDAFDDALQDATAVDAVEVVRCSQCKYSDPMEDGGRYCQLVRDCSKPDDFCSRGKRWCE